jgi:phosphoribosylformimino-5-aminoimidazole carboxamide ribotide isomerase
MSSRCHCQRAGALVAVLQGRRSPMRVIPVIDLMRGQVVRGVAGRRDEYRPIHSRLAADAHVRSVGRALAEAGFRQTYLADLDAIAGARPAWHAYAELMACGLELLVDAGVSDGSAARRLAAFHAEGRPLAAIVVGLESLPDWGTLAQGVADVGAARLVFSLDLKAGAPLVSDAWCALDPMAIAALAWRAGVRRMIVLDLSAVGVGRGVPTLPLLRGLRCFEPGLELIAGGGVRGPDDLRALQAAGCDAALVSSALHDGRLSAQKCASTRSW